jgi:hypothetical protein
MERKDVYKLIDGERDYQSSLETDRSRHDGHRHTVGDYLVMLNSYMSKANNAWTDNGTDLPALDVIRKLAGICIHCMEEYDTPARINTYKE